MTVRTGYEHHPKFWNAYLASSVGNHLTGKQPDHMLRDDYELFLDSPACDRTLRDLLPPAPRKPKKGTVKT